jgi:predicted  nucleic acid-binding Zn-ribbon protein
MSSECMDVDLTNVELLRKAAEGLRSALGHANRLQDEVAQLQQRVAILETQLASAEASAKEDFRRANEHRRLLEQMREGKVAVIELKPPRARA